MSLARTLILAAVLLFLQPLANACTCFNSTPVQQTMERYAQRAVFTARVIQSAGSVYINHGMRSSERVIAIVRHRYWGFPSNWPDLVILDGRGACDMAILEGKEYLVSADRGSHFGEFFVAGCSRTEALESSPVDMRTLDGSLCSGPGGTLIGHVSYSRGMSYSREKDQEPVPVRNAVLTFRDYYGKPYVTRSDSEGIYELLHVPPGDYRLDSQTGLGQIALGGGEVTGGQCKEAPVVFTEYTITGRLIPGISRYANVFLVGTDGARTGLNSSVDWDGRFYFQNVPPGDYLVMARFDLVGGFHQHTDVYYPGVSTSAKAARLHISGQTLRQSLDFLADAIPLTSIPVFVESPGSQPARRVSIRLQNSVGYAVDGFTSLTGIPVLVAAVRGQTYGIRILSDEDHPISETARVTAATTMKMTRITLAPGR